jgi:hypothetical protein
MKRSALLALAGISISLGLAPVAWAAGTISAITPATNRVVLVDGKATIRFMVSGQGNEGNDCGIWVNYGDNENPDTRIIGRSEGNFPREFSHSFNRAGQFTVTAKGERVKQTFGCDGQALTTVTVVAAPVAEAPRERERWRDREAACPDGWQVREGTFKRDTGAFTCVAMYPQERMDCGRGLRYFERDGQIGCRPRDNR